jgi:hypothetical protein
MPPDSLWNIRYWGLWSAWPGPMASRPAPFTTSVALGPGSINRATHASFSERDHWRRSTDVMTSIHAIVALSVFASATAFEVNGDAGSGPNGSDSPESQPTAKKQPGPTVSDMNNLILLVRSRQATTFSNECHCEDASSVQRSPKAALHNSDENTLPGRIDRNLLA